MSKLLIGFVKISGHCVAGGPDLQNPPDRPSTLLPPPHV